MRLVRGIFVALAAALAVPFAAKAAPQVLAALPSDYGIPFTCEDGVCSAGLSTYCLQRNRPAPNAGTPYFAANPTDFKLVLATEDGETRELPIEGHVAFTGSRGFMSISAFIDEKLLARHKAKRARITVAANASLVPFPVEGDPNPLTAEEIAYATGSLRGQGSDIIDGSPLAGAAQVLSNVINRLPVRGRVTPAGMESIWENAIGDDLPASDADVTVPTARDAFEACLNGAEGYGYFGIRRCLEFRHDDLIRGLNVKYWRSLPGS